MRLKHLKRRADDRSARIDGSLQAPAALPEGERAPNADQLQFITTWV